ncbi:MAG: hypothetical protein KDA69_08045 [Planctomycetaceae bacterium]|nr:hypothetical protein [Planctomycetaceae bacterium]MCA9031981.1 hypothetical protein [Planctomycetaceae bacterium]MCA9044255.1 hypothetical protein [Planctomycetaceae bacterium]MCB9950212.1 hypothetical protein [Planctomycetaceae bacterium]
MTESNKSKWNGCLIAVAVVLALGLMLLLGIWFLVHSALTSFEAYRDTMCIREDLVVRESQLRYSPGFDAAMWCKFTAEAGDIGEVFDESRVDTAEFSGEDYKFRVDWIKDAWWDVETVHLKGGDVEVNGSFMRVGYLDNGDGTLTVYIFWFEV